MLNSRTLDLLVRELDWEEVENAGHLSPFIAFLICNLRSDTLRAIGNELIERKEPELQILAIRFWRECSTGRSDIRQEIICRLSNPEAISRPEVASMMIESLVFLGVDPVFELLESFAGHQSEQVRYSVASAAGSSTWKRNSRRRKRLLGQLLLDTSDVVSNAARWELASDRFV